VLTDGWRIGACLKLAVTLDGAAVTTIDGLGLSDDLHPLRAAFIAYDAVQCGSCTPGRIRSGVGLIAEGHARTRGARRRAASSAAAAPTPTSPTR